MNKRILFVCLALFAPALMRAEVPTILNYQGQRLDASGQALTGAVSIAVAVFDAETGGDMVFSQHIGSVTSADGLFSFNWGGAGLTDALTNDTCWLQVHVDNDTLNPRQRLVSAPYALHAARADTAATLGGFTHAQVAVPPGTILQFGAPTAPEGYLSCDGAQVSRATYADLFAAIGTAYGSGDGSTTFHLPDYRGRFVRGVSAGTGRDPNAGTRTASATGGNTGDAVGTLQADELKSHAHSVDPPNTTSSTAGNHSHAQYVSANCGTGGTGHRRDWNQDCNGLGTYSQGINTGTAGNHSHTVNIGAFSSASTGGSETRPLNIAAHFIIKY